MKGSRTQMIWFDEDAEWARRRETIDAIESMCALPAPLPVSFTSQTMSCHPVEDLKRMRDRLGEGRGST